MLASVERVPFEFDPRALDRSRARSSGVDFAGRCSLSILQDVRQRADGNRSISHAKWRHPGSRASSIRATARTCCGNFSAGSYCSCISPGAVDACRPAWNCRACACDSSWGSRTCISLGRVLPVWSYRTWAVDACRPAWSCRTSDSSWISGRALAAWSYRTCTCDSSWGSRTWIPPGRALAAWSYRTRTCDSSSGSRTLTAWSQRRSISTAKLLGLYECYPITGLCCSSNLFHFLIWPIRDISCCPACPSLVATYHPAHRHVSRAGRCSQLVCASKFIGVPPMDSWSE